MAGPEVNPYVRVRSNNLSDPNSEAWKSRFDEQGTESASLAKTGCDGQGNIIPYYSPQFDRVAKQQTESLVDSCKLTTGMSIILDRTATHKPRLSGSKLKKELDKQCTIGPQELSYLLNAKKGWTGKHERVHAKDSETVYPEMCKGRNQGNQVSVNQIPIDNKSLNHDQRRVVVFLYITEATAYYLTANHWIPNEVANLPKGLSTKATTNALEASAHEEAKLLRDEYVNKLRDLGYLTSLPEYYEPQDLKKELNTLRKQHGLVPIEDFEKPDFGMDPVTPKK